MTDAATQLVTFDGTSDKRISKAETVEVDGEVLRKGGKAVALTADQLRRVQELPGLKFSVKGSGGNGGDELLKLDRGALDKRAADAGVDEPEKLDNKEAVAAAIREAEGA